MAGFRGMLRESADSVCHHEWRQGKHMAKIRDTKGRFSPEQVLTGRELCQWLCVDYAEVQRQREEDAKDNYNYFVSEVLRIAGME